MRAVDVVVELEAAGTNRQRDAAVRRAWEANCEEFFVGVQLSCDAQWSMPLERLPQIEEDDDGSGSFDFKEFLIVRAQLGTPGINPEDARTIVYDAADRANVTEWNRWYRKILLRTLHTNLPMDRIVHVLKKLTA